MKKFISLLLCLVMCASIFTGTVVPVSAAGQASNYLAVSNGGYSDDLITYTVSLKPNQTKLTGAIVYAVYDSTALEVVDCRAAGSVDGNGDVDPTVDGIYATGPVHGDANAYSMGYISGSGYNVGASQTQLFVITFKAISQDRLDTTVTFKCVEFITDDGDDTNNIDKTLSDASQTFATHTFHTLSIPQVTEVNSYYDGLKVVWNAEPGADKYHLYRKAKGETSWELLKEDITETSHIDNTISKGTEYSYTLSAENAGGETDYDINGLAGMNFGNIESLTVAESADGSGALVQWSSLAGAESYELYRKLGEAGEEGWQLIKKLSATSFTDTTVGSGITYNYKVRAFQGKYSADMVCDVPSFKFISAPVTTVKNTFDGLEISFVPSNGADRFVIEKKSGNGEFAQYKEISAAEIEDGKFTALDTEVAPEETYTYTIQAFSEELESVKKTLSAVKRLSATTITAIKNNSKGVELSWNAVADADGYDIYRKGSTSTAFVKIDESESQTYTDTTARSGYVYTYSVVAKNKTGHGDYALNEMQIMYLNTPVIRSIASNNQGIKIQWFSVNGAETYNVYRSEEGKAAILIANVEEAAYTNLLADIVLDRAYTYTVEAIAGEYKSGIYEDGAEGRHFGVVDNLKVTTGNAQATLTWTKIPADSYIVYRKTVNENSWGDPIATNVTTNTYTDKTMASGVTYEYMVNAKKGNSIADMVCDSVIAKILHIPQITAKNTSKGIEVKVVENIGGADKYVVEKLVGSSYVNVGEIAGGAISRVFVDTSVEPKVEYKYRVYAVANETTEAPLVKSGYSSVKTVERIGAPDILSIENTIVGIKFSWEEVENAQAYQILRKTGDDGEWESYDFIQPDEYDELATEREDMYVDGGVKYYYTVNAITSDGGNTGYDEDGKGITFIETPDIYNPTQTADGVKITWDALQGVDKYTVYRRDSGKWTIIGSSKTDSFIDKNYYNYGTTQRYTVRASAADGSRGLFDTEGVTVKITTPSVTATNYKSGIQVKWKKVSGATKYIVYRKTGNGKWAVIKTVGASTLYYNDTAVNKKGGTTYSYTVRAQLKSGTTPYRAYPVKRLYNPTFTLSNYGSGVQVKWSKVAGASSYIVYRKYGSGGWTKLGTTTGTVFNDLGVNKHAGKTFTYAVRAVSGTSQSAYNSVSVKRLLAPKLASVKSTKSGIQFAWKASTGASGYYVYRKTTGGWTRIATVKSGKTVKYVDKSAKKGVTYTYTVRAYSGSSASSYYAGLKCKDKY